MFLKLKAKLVPAVLLVTSSLWLATLMLPFFYSLIFPNRYLCDAIEAFEGRPVSRPELAKLGQEIAERYGRLQHAIRLGAHYYGSVDYNAGRRHKSNDVQYTYLARFTKMRHFVVILSASNDQLRINSHALKGSILRDIGDDPKKFQAAESEYRAAAQLDPNNAAIHLNLGIVLLRESREPDGIAELNTYLRLAPDGREANYARKLIANPKRAGNPLAPPFSVTTLDGQQVSLDQLAGKIVFMDFWATWCPPCRAAVPEFKELIKKYPPSKLVLISFSADSDQEAWRDFISKHDMEWPQYWDRDGRIRAEFSVHAFPTYLVIDQDGFVGDRIVGLNEHLSVVGRLKQTLQLMLSAN